MKCSAPCLVHNENATAVITNSSHVSSPPSALAPLLPVEEQGRVQVRGGAGEGRVVYCTGLCGL